MWVLLKNNKEAINLSTVQKANWDRDILILYYEDENFRNFSREDAQLIWDAICKSTGKNNE